MTDRVLSVSMRPNDLDSIIGQETIVNEIKNIFKTKRIPHFFLITGSTGSGKTTLARIIAMMLQSEDPINSPITSGIHGYDITEINSSDKNGIDDMRELIELIKYKSRSISKVIIMDEMHQLSNHAQNALLKATEDAPNHVYFICCTNNDSKILPTLKRRAYKIVLNQLTKKTIFQLIEKAKIAYGYKESIDEILQAIITAEITSPGIILQIVEKYFNGASAIESVTGSSSSGSIDVRKVCSLVTKGDWKSLVLVLKDITKDDIQMLRNCILGYLKAVLLKSGSLTIAKVIKIIGEDTYDLPIFIANIRIACEEFK